MGFCCVNFFENIAAVHGEGLSGACLEISGDGNYWMLQWPEKKLKTLKSIK